MSEPNAAASGGPGTTLRVAIGVALAALFVVAFYGFADLNGLGGPLRSYGMDWFDHVPYKEAQLFLALVFLALPATLFLGRALHAGAGEKLACGGRWLARRPLATVAGCVAVAVIASVLVGFLATQHAPLTDDEQIYRFQASLLADGRLTAPAPPSEHPFASQFIVFKDGWWTGVYPWGHTALLVVGGWLGSHHVWPHLAAGLIVLLTFWLGRELFGAGDDATADRTSPLVAAGLTALSPFLAFTTATLHNVTTSTVLTLLGALGLVRAVVRGRFGWAVVAGLAFGANLHARPYTAMAMGVAMGLCALVIAVRLKRNVLALCGGFLLGLVPFIALYCVINWQLTGELWEPIASSSLAAKKKRMFGFGSAREMAYNIEHTPLLALGKSGTNFLRLALWTLGSALSVGGVLALAAGLRRVRWELVLLVPVVALFGAYYFFFTSPVYDTGPAYYLDLVPFLALANARALGTLAERGTVRAPALAAGTLAIVVIALATFWPTQGKAAHHVSDAVLGPYRAVERARLSNAIVFWNAPPGTQSWVMTRKLPHWSLRDDVIFAKDTDQKKPLLAAFPGRATYAIRYPDGKPVVMKWRPGPSGNPDVDVIVEPLP